MVTESKVRLYTADLTKAGITEDGQRRLSPNEHGYISECSRITLGRQLGAAGGLRSGCEDN